MTQTIKGITGEMKVGFSPITGYIYYFQPFYRTVARKERRKYKKL